MRGSNPEFVGISPNPSAPKNLRLPPKLLDDVEKMADLAIQAVQTNHVQHAADAISPVTHVKARLAGVQSGAEEQQMRLGAMDGPANPERLLVAARRGSLPGPWSKMRY